MTEVKPVSAHYHDAELPVVAWECYCRPWEAATYPVGTWARMAAAQAILDRWRWERR